MIAEQSCGIWSLIDMFFLVLIGFLLPWQTRFLIRTPMAQNVVWDFGVVSIFLSQALLALYLCFEFWQNRKAVVSFVREIKNSLRKKIAISLIVLFLAEQLFFSLDRLLTLQWIIGALLLVGLGIILHHKKDARIPFAAAFIISVVLQALLAAMQLFVSSTFASTILGMSAHKAAESGTAVIEYASQRFMRAYGGQSHPNIFGGITLIGLMLFNWLLKYKKTLGIRKNIIQFVILVSAALFFSFSRAAWLALFLWIATLIYDRKKLRESQITMMRWIVGTFAILLIIFAPLVITRTNGGSKLEQRSISERTAGVGQWGRVIKSHGLFGTGLGSYTAALSDSAGDRRVPVHTVPLLAFAEIGLLGAILLITSAMLFRVRVVWKTEYVILAPILLFDHYLFSLWAGQILFAAFLFQLFEVGNKDEADNNQK